MISISVALTVWALLLAPGLPYCLWSLSDAWQQVRLKVFGRLSGQFDRDGR